MFQEVQVTKWCDCSPLTKAAWVQAPPCLMSHVSRGVYCFCPVLQGPCQFNRPNVFPFQTMCHSLENMILCLRFIHIHISPHAQLFDKEMILKGMTHGLKWENIVTQRIRSILVNLLGLPYHPPC